MERGGVSGVGKVTESIVAASGVQQVRRTNRAEARGGEGSGFKCQLSAGCPARRSLRQWREGVIVKRVSLRIVGAPRRPWRRYPRAD
jgi:hypothetical protein